MIFCVSKEWGLFHRWKVVETLVVPSAFDKAMESKDPFRSKGLPGHFFRKVIITPPTVAINAGPSVWRH